MDMAWFIIKLTHVVAKAIFDIVRLVEAALRQRLYPYRGGGPTEAMKASHSGAISASGGRLAMLTRRFVFPMVSLSKEATLRKRIGKCVAPHQAEPGSTSP